MFAELVAAVLALALFAGSAASLFRAEWNRVRCAHLAFETAHRARLSLAPSDRLRGDVRIEDFGSSVRATAQCGEAVETVELPRLEGLLNATK